MARPRASLHATNGGSQYADAQPQSNVPGAQASGMGTHENSVSNATLATHPCSGVQRSQPCAFPPSVVAEESSEAPRSSSLLPDPPDVEVPEVLPSAAPLESGSLAPDVLLSRAPVPEPVPEPMPEPVPALEPASLDVGSPPLLASGSSSPQPQGTSTSTSEIVRGGRDQSMDESVRSPAEESTVGVLARCAGLCHTALPTRMDPHASQVFCPQCGAPAPFRGTTVSLVCEFCDSTIVRTGIDIHLIGKVSAIVDNGSPIILGSRGRHHGLPFEVVGRLQVQYGRGTWNEWYVEFANGESGWLADALGQFALLRAADSRLVAGRVPAFWNLQLRTPITIGNTPYVVVDKRGAAYKGAEGSLPFPAQPGVNFHGADLRGHDGEFATLDWGPDPSHQQPLLFVGEAIELAAVGLHPLRSFDGWRFAGYDRPPAGPGPR
jgi:hypothetical protein